MYDYKYRINDRGDKMVERVGKRFISLIIVCVMIFTIGPVIKVNADESPSVSYCSHIQKLGWQPFVSNGTISGTTGKDFRLEALKIKVSGDNLGVKYSTHVQKLGWQEYKSDGEISGTEGQGLRVEAVKVELTGKHASNYSIYYRLYVQNSGWLDWAKNGEISGTSGFANRLEAIEVKIIKNGQALPGNTENTYISKPKLVYRSHVQKIGWQEWANEKEASGTIGKALRLEAIEAKVSETDNLGIKYSAHIQKIGWQPFESNGNISGTTGQGLRLEAVKFELTGSNADNYDIYYRAHVQSKGWLSWVKNGEVSGITGKSLRLEAMEVKIELKNKVSGTAIKVLGSKLTDKNGNIIRLKGISTHGINWYPQYVNKEEFKSLRDNMGINLIRLAMYTSEYNGYCTGGDKDNLKKIIDNGVNYATELGMYVIIDWHILSDNNPNTNKQEAINFFNEIANKYKNHTNVLYEICNEPSGGTSWSSIKSYAEDVINVIRKYDSNAVIIVGTPTWSQDVDIAANNPIKNYSNIMYSFHFYAATHKKYYRDKVKAALDKNLPVFVSEFSICDASGNGDIDYNEAASWSSFIKDNDLSCAMWNLSNKNETSSIINSNCNKVNGWTDSDLSNAGKWLKAFYNE